MAVALQDVGEGGEEEQGQEGGLVTFSDGKAIRNEALGIILLSAS